MGMLRICKSCGSGYGWEKGYDDFCLQCTEKMEEEKQIRIHRVFISFVCPECDRMEEVLLSDILDVGNPMCPECNDHPPFLDNEMLVDSDFITIKE